MPESKNPNTNLIELITSPDYKLIFRYHTGVSFMEPESRDYIFELHRCIKDHNKLIYKQWKPSSWEKERDIETWKKHDPQSYKNMKKWGSAFNMGKVQRYTTKIMELINEFPPPESLIKYNVCDGSMSDLMIHIGRKKIKYDWMMIDESQERFEKRIWQIGYIAKAEGA